MDIGLRIMREFILLISEGILRSTGAGAQFGVGVLGNLLVGFLGGLGAGTLGGFGKVVGGVLQHS